MSFTTVYHSVWILLILTAVAKGQDPISCNPALEGSELTITGIWNTQKSMTVRTNDDKIILVCIADKRCSPMIPFPFKHHETQDGENRMKFTLRIENATIAMTGFWGVLYDADPKPFRKSCVVAAFDKNIQCYKEHFIDGVSVQCVTRKVSPKAKCLFKIISEDDVPDVKGGQIEYVQGDLLSENVYANSSCKKAIVLKNDMSATLKFDVEVTMFPDATGNDSDMELGSSVNIPFDLFLSLSCLPTPEGGTSHLSITWNNITPIKILRDDKAMTITCLPDTPCNSSKLTGYTMDVQKASGGRSTLTLSFQNATRFGSRQGFTSWTVTVLGTSRNVTEKCWIYEPTVNISCKYQPSIDGINIACNAPRTFPPGKCQFKAKNQVERIVDPKTITYQHDELKNSMGYRTECSTLVPWNMIDSTQPALYVTVYPNITGDLRDALYGATATVELSIEGPPVELQQCPSQVEKGEIVSCTCTSSSSNVTVFWNSSSGEVSVDNNTITFHAFAFNEYRCQGKDSTGAIGVPKIYTPKISYPPFVKYGKELPNNETVADASYISCSGVNYSSTFAKLIKEDNEDMSWKMDQHVQQMASNTEKCERSKFYKCILTADYKSSSESYPDFIECTVFFNKSKSGNGQNVQVVVAVIMVILLIGLVIGALFILWKVKPSVFYFLQRRWHTRQNEYEDPAQDSYKKGQEEDLECNYAAPTFPKDAKSLLKLNEAEAENGGYITPIA